MHQENRAALLPFKLFSNASLSTTLNHGRSILSGFFTLVAAVSALLFSTGYAAAGGSTVFSMPVHSCLARFEADTASLRRLPQGLMNASRTKTVQILCPLQEDIVTEGPFNNIPNVCETDFFQHNLFAAVSLRTALSGTTAPSLTLLKVASGFPTSGNPPLATKTTNGAVIPGSSAFTTSRMQVSLDCTAVDLVSAPTAIVRLPPFATLVYLDYGQD